MATRGRRRREGRGQREGGRGECGTRRRGADAESSWQAPGIARDRPGSASNSAPPFSSLTLSHVLLPHLLLPASPRTRNVVLSRPPTTSLHRTVRPRL